MVICETPDFAFPMQADVYHPIVEQGIYGEVKKTWILDRTIACSFAAAGTAFKEEVTPNINITQEKLLLGRCKTDVRVSSMEAQNSITNVIITNIKDTNKIIYNTQFNESNKLIDILSNKLHNNLYNKLNEQNNMAYKLLLQDNYNSINYN